MKVTIFGATGKLGQLLVSNCLKSNWEVTVFTRNPDAVKGKDTNQIVLKGDVLNPSTIEPAIIGRDAVLSAVATPGMGIGPRTIHSESARNIVSVMEKVGVKRLILCGFGALSKNNTFLYRYLVNPIILKHIIADKIVEELVVEESDLDWTIVRAYRLTDGPFTGKYRTGLEFLKNAWFISRADVADFMIRQLTDKQYIRKKPAIAY